jgi:SAM-dependent methyltransferase
MPIFDRLFYRRYRREAMSHATGRLLLVGLGPGTDLLFLPSTVTSVAAVEPEAPMRRMASALARRRGITAEIVDGVGESIPFPDNSFDSVHVGLVLCSVDDVTATLGEIRRVLAPGGRLVVLEHVRGDGVMGWFQDLITKPMRLLRPDSTSPRCAAFDALWCHPRAHLICRDSPPSSIAPGELFSPQIRASGKSIIRRLESVMSHKLLPALGTAAGGFLTAGLISLTTGPLAHADGDDLVPAVGADFLVGDVMPAADADFLVGPLQNFGLFTDQSFADPTDNEFVATVISNQFFTDVLTSGADPSDGLAAFGITGDTGIGVAGETIDTFIVPSDPALDFTFSLPFADPLAELFTQLLPLGF